MIVALAVIWIGFNIVSGGNFITPRNLWNLSVQSSSIAIMATGMVLIIVSRNIDLSVGSLLGFIGYTMAMVQTDWLPDVLGIGLRRAVQLGHRPRRRASPWARSIGGVPGLHHRLRRRAVVHRHPRRAPRLARPDLPVRRRARPLAPLDATFQLIGGGPKGSLGRHR